MTQFVALLRAVNVAGRSVAMADVRALLGELRFTGIQTLLQSGNVIFRASSGGSAPQAGSLEKKLEKELARAFGLDIDVFVRSADDIAAVLARNSFSAEAASDPGRLVVFFMNEAPLAAAVAAAQSAIAGRETMRADGKHLYVYYPDGQGTTKLTNAVLERRLGVRGTARNWNTVRRIATALGVG